MEPEKKKQALMENMQFPSVTSEWIIPKILNYVYSHRHAKKEGIRELLIRKHLKMSVKMR